MSDKLTREDVLYSITILKDNIEHIDEMIAEKPEGKSRYASTVVLDKKVVAMLQAKRASLARTADWLTKKVSQS